MSQTPSPRKRRRIAGERRPAGAVAGPTGTSRESDATTKRGKPLGSPTRAAPEQASREHGQPGRRPPRAVPGRVLLVLALVAAALVTVAVVGVAEGMGVRGYLAVQEQQQVERARRTAPAAAERAAAAILAYDHETLEADRDAAARFMTPEYRKRYKKTFGLVLEEAPDLEAVVTAEVKASGVVHAEPDRANVLLFVNQRTVSTAHGGEPQLALNRVVLAMEQRGGSWLVDDITAY